MGIGDFGVTFSIFAPPRSYLACVQDTGCIFGHKSIFCRKLFFDLEILIFENNQIWPFFHEKMVIFVIFGWKSKLARSVFGVRGSYLVFRELTEYVFRESKIFDEKYFFDEIFAYFDQILVMPWGKIPIQMVKISIQNRPYDSKKYFFIKTFILP